MVISRCCKILTSAVVAATTLGTVGHAEQWKGAPGPNGTIWRNGGVAIGLEPARGASQSTLLQLERPLSGSADELLFKATSSYRDMPSTIFQIDTKRVYVGGAAGKASVVPDGVYDLAVGRGVAIGLVNVTEKLPTDYKLAVGGKVLAEEIRVRLVKDWADDVFKPGYALKTLPEIEAYVQTHHHLPGVPTAVEAEQDGIEIGAMQAKLLEKIEELTLHLIKQDKTIAILERKISQLESKDVAVGHMTKHDSH